MHKLISKTAFTLIELLIVIAIIGILAVALLPSVLGAPGRARDASKRADVNNIVAAVETFYAANGAYPSANACIDPAASSGDMQKLNTYFKGGKAPVPSNSTMDSCVNQYVYCKLASPNNYAIGVQMENDAATKGFKAAAGTVLTACATEATGADASGKFYWAVQ